MTTLTPTIKLNDGTAVPWLAFGTGTALYGRDATNAIRLAVDKGITHLDGAQIYDNEETLGAGIRSAGKPRSELYIVTKLKGLNPGQTVKETLVISLKKLGVDYVDLFLVHSPHPANVDGTLKAVWQGMEEVKREGLARSIGVSNFRVEDLQTVLDGATVVPAVNQIELHPYVWKAAEPIVKFGLEHGITPASYGGQTPLVRAAGGPVDAVLTGIQGRLENACGKSVTPGQVLTKWIIQKGAIVVTTTSKESRIAEFQDTISVPDLTKEEIDAIEEAGSKLHKRIYMKAVFGE
ncbi:Aldo/keto reductase [Pluteus cervinus]|uniref:Aldo/keto reductase n=1 Tax=Pluteus cervinus TaxID=181527 RepID=A0ACD3BEU7_9AGAR|nr:Aldo/keto reductase [Pluteus cervinus]